MSAPSTSVADPPAEAAGPDGPPSRSGGWWRAAILILSAMVGMWILSAVALLIYTWEARDPELRVLEIPAGTSERVAAGENPLEIPSTWSFLAGDTLRIVNEDGVDHWIGSFPAPAGETVEYLLGTTIGGSLFCSVHPDEAIELDVDASGFDWRLTVFPTVVLGPALGLVLAGVGWVFHHLDDPDTPSPSPSGKEPPDDR